MNYTTEEIIESMLEEIIEKQKISGAYPYEDVNEGKKE